MLQVRHRACHARLFDSQLSVEETSGPSPDVSVKCPRCSREQKGIVLAKYRLQLPKKQAPIIPEVVRCTNLGCMSHILSIALPYTLTNHQSHIEILCGKCGELNHLKLAGIVEVEGA